MELWAADEKLEENIPNSNFTTVFGEICGWIPDFRINYRNTNEPVQNRTPKSFDFSRRHLLLGYAPTSTIDYDFRHYNNTKKYIEQYRRHHTCCGPLEKLTQAAIGGRYRTVYYAGAATHNAGLRIDQRVSQSRTFEESSDKLRNHLSHNFDESEFASLESVLGKKQFSALGIPLTVEVLRRHAIEAQSCSSQMNRPKHIHEMPSTAALRKNNLNLTPGRETPPCPQLPYFPTQTPKHAPHILHDRLGMLGYLTGDTCKHRPSHPYDLYSRLINAVTYLRAVKDKDSHVGLINDSLIPIRSKSPNLGNVWVRGKRLMTPGIVGDEDSISDVGLPSLLSKPKPPATHHIGLKLPVFMRRKRTTQTIPSSKAIREGRDKMYRLSLKGNATGKKVDATTCGSNEICRRTPTVCQGVWFDCNESIRSESTGVKG
ncbi:uncharacterized protein LOC117102710 isoform X2 [Anneissia japonica]|nr:uncharacterized protein LOC117102710 isoform X2 [Anneissia japonica]